VQTTLIVISSILALISPVVYSRGILKGEVRPHRTTRFVLLVISALAAATLFAAGDRVALWLAVIALIQAVFIFALSIRRGMGGWSPSDLLCLAVALIGIVLWQITSNPLLGLFFAIGADFMGMIPAIIKTYRDPNTEIISFFLIDVFASMFTLAALSAWTAGAVAYPLYILFINACMSSLIWLRRRATNL
jgi:hypothetical protein